MAISLNWCGPIGLHQWQPLCNRYEERVGANLRHLKGQRRQTDRQLVMQISILTHSKLVLQPCRFGSGCPVCLVHTLSFGIKRQNIKLYLKQRNFQPIPNPSYFGQADSGQLYSSAMQGLSSYANNIMGHTMNQYAAQSSLLSTQVGSSQCSCQRLNTKKI